MLIVAIAEDNSWSLFFSIKNYARHTHHCEIKNLSTQNFRLRAEDTRSKPEGPARWSRSAWLQRKGGRSCVILPRRASQFDPAIGKERKFISN